MKRIITIVVMFVLVLGLFGCRQPEEDYEDIIIEEFLRIAEDIPYEFEEDLQLPAASDGFTVKYKADNRALNNGLLPYIGQDQDVVMTLYVTLSYQTDTYTYQLEIVQLEQEDPVEVAFQERYELLLSLWPNPMVSNVTIPTGVAGVPTPTSQTCGEVERGRVLYSFPENSYDCAVTYNITINQETRTLVVPITVSAFDDLPQIPQVFVDTGNQPIDSKDTYTSATITVVTDGNSTYREITNESMLIRLRGNSTRWMPKASYKIKFPEQTAFLSDYKEKDWVLLANFTDQSLVRNALAFSLSERLNMAFSPSSTFVDLYINGEYVGNYQLTDQIEVTNDRVDIEENVSDIDTGYLLEYDWGQYGYGLGNTGDNYFLLWGIPFVLHSPDWEDDHYQAGHLDYIESFMQQLFNTLENGEDYSDLIDEASFIDWFIVNEVFKNVDSGYSSIYFYKPKSGLLHMGPVWDFDLSSGNPGHLQDDLRGPTGWYTSRPDKNILFYYLMQYPSFQSALKNRWNEVYDDAILAILDEIWPTADAMTYSRYQNFERWDIIGSNYDWYTAPEVYDLKTYDEQVWFVYDYMNERITWLNQAINELQ